MGSTKFTDNSGEVLSALEKAVHNGLTAVGMTAERYAKKDTPVDTEGMLRTVGELDDGGTLLFKEVLKHIEINKQKGFLPYIQP